MKNLENCQQAADAPHSALLPSRHWPALLHFSLTPADFVMGWDLIFFGFHFTAVLIPYLGRREERRKRERKQRGVARVM